MDTFHTMQAEAIKSKRIRFVRIRGRIVPIKNFGKEAANFTKSAYKAGRGHLGYVKAKRGLKKAKGFRQYAGAVKNMASGKAGYYKHGLAAKKSFKVIKPALRKIGIAGLTVAAVGGAYSLLNKDK